MVFHREHKPHPDAAREQPTGHHLALWLHLIEAVGEIQAGEGRADAKRLMGSAGSHAVGFIIKTIGNNLPVVLDCINPGLAGAGGEGDAGGRAGQQQRPLRATKAEHGARGDRTSSQWCWLLQRCVTSLPLFPFFGGGKTILRPASGRGADGGTAGRAGGASQLVQEGHVTRRRRGWRIAPPG